MERLISKYKRARNQWYVLYQKFEESEERRAFNFSRYKETKKELKRTKNQLRDAERKIEVLEELMYEKHNIIESKNNLIMEQYEMIQEKEAMLQAIEEIEKDCRNVRIYPTQGNCHNKGK